MEILGFYGSHGMIDNIFKVGLLVLGVAYIYGEHYSGEWLRNGIKFSSLDLCVNQRKVYWNEEENKYGVNRRHVRNCLKVR